MKKIEKKYSIKGNTNSCIDVNVYFIHVSFLEFFYICSANQLTGSSMMATLAFNELINVGSRNKTM